MSPYFRKEHNPSVEELRDAEQGWRDVAITSRKAVSMGIALCPDVYEHNAEVADRVADEFKAKLQARESELVFGTRQVRCAERLCDVAEAYFKSKED